MKTDRSWEEFLNSPFQAADGRTITVGEATVEDIRAHAARLRAEAEVAEREAHSLTLEAARLTDAA